MRLHHVGYATTDLGRSAEAFAAIGYARYGDVTRDVERHVNILFMRGACGDLIELVEPSDDRAPVKNALEAQRGTTHPYHMCFEVDDIQREMDELRSRGFIQTTSLSPAPAIANRRVVFMYGKRAGLVELVESEGQWER